MKLLVANRAEIAVRIIATAAVLGIETVGVYPDDDAACAHVARADAAVAPAGAGPAAYLDIDAAIVGAVTGRVDTLHPGYGFLAENARVRAGLRRRLASLRRARAAGSRPFGDKTGRGPSGRRPRHPGGPGTGWPGRARAGARVPGQPRTGRRRHGEGGRRRRGPRPARRYRDPAGLDEASGDAPPRPRPPSAIRALYVEELLTRAPARRGAGHRGRRGRGARARRPRLQLQRRRQKLIEIAPAPCSRMTSAPGCTRRPGPHRRDGLHRGWPRSSSWSPRRRYRVPRGAIRGSRSSTR